MDNNEEYGYYNKERGEVLKDIEHFLLMILAYFEDMEEKRNLKREEIAAAKLQPLVKSLRLLHALYGYPEKDDEQGTSMNKRAVKDLVVGNNGIKGKNEKGFEYYCPSVRDDEFWAFEFEKGTFELQSLLREPAYMFLEMVRAMFTISGRAHAEAGRISRRLLRNLPDGNLLRPEVWAQCKTTDPVRYGVSLGVRHFVRPLYLYTKLSPNVNNYPQVPQVAISLEKVKAFLIKGDDLKKQPCITCQRFFGFFSFPIIGNCAEYDVIGNVQPNLLQTEQGKQFKAACQQHLNAFNTMMQDIHINKLPDQEDILRRYFKNTRRPNKPKVLKFEWKSEAIGGFELTAVEKWWR